MSEQKTLKDKQEAFQKLRNILTSLRLARQMAHDLHYEAAIGNEYKFLFEHDQREFVKVVGQTYEDLNKEINRIKRYERNLCPETL